MFLFGEILLLVIIVEDLIFLLLEKENIVDLLLNSLLVLDVFGFEVGVEKSFFVNGLLRDKDGNVFFFFMFFEFEFVKLKNLLFMLEFFVLVFGGCGREFILDFFRFLKEGRFFGYDICVLVFVLLIGVVLKRVMLLVLVVVVVVWCVRCVGGCCLIWILV